MTGRLRARDSMRRPCCHRNLLLPLLCIAVGLGLYLLVLPIPADWRHQRARELLMKSLSLSVLDASQKYRVRQFMVVGDRWQPLSAGNWSTCLALHASLTHVHHVEQQARSWSGPVSAALFAAGDDVHLLIAYVTFLRRCRQHVSDRVSFHVLWPTEHPPGDTFDGGWDQLGELNCWEDDEQVLRRLLDQQTRPVGENMSYPQNLARNTARLACTTSLTLCPDADMLPRPGVDLAAELAILFTRQPPCKKCAYVLPVFEVDVSLPGLPQNKWELRQLVQGKKARPYHWEIYKANQKPLNPERWLNLSNGSSSQLSVAYEIKYVLFFEPVYVAASGDLPVFDEMFVGYGFTRNTQAYEMFASGWRFFALDHTFLIHWGLQSMKTRPHWRVKEISINDRRFLKWTSHVALKYDSDRLKLLWTYPDYTSSMTSCPRKSCKTARPKPKPPSLPKKKTKT